MIKKIFSVIFAGLFLFSIIAANGLESKAIKKRKKLINKLVNYELPINHILGRPTDHSITINTLVDKDMVLFFEYGTESNTYSDSTESMEMNAGIPATVIIDSLIPDSRYFYRMLYHESGENRFLQGEEYSFHTQRSPGNTFVFDILADSHLYDKKCNTELYKATLQNVVEDKPDFLIDLGDTFGDDHDTAITYNDMLQLHLNQRNFFGRVCHSAPLFLCLGNHEGEMGYYLDGTENNLAVYATRARKYYYSNPFPDHFYSGNSTVEEFNDLPENYYAWEWGDALFIVLDVYRYVAKSPKPRGWDWTLGEQQYNWFKQTLQQSDAKFKFVFAHHVLGQTRGALKWAKLFEFGGFNQDGKTWDFDNKRPGWEIPIHQLMVENGVTIFFQGHDHLFAREELDDLVYQECPMPSDATYVVGMENASSYTGDILENSGHLRVTVSDTNVAVDYIRAFLAKDEINDHKNGENAFSYSVQSMQTSATPGHLNSLHQPFQFSLGQNYPNPFNPSTSIPFEISRRSKVALNIYNSLGQKIRTLTNGFLTAGKYTYTWDGIDQYGSCQSSGIYFYKLETDKNSTMKKALLVR